MAINSILFIKIKMGRKFAKKIILVVLSIAIVGGLFNFAQKALSYSGLDYNYEIISQSEYPEKLEPGITTPVSITIKNTGTQAWYSSGEKIVRLGTGSEYGSSYQKRDYTSEFANDNWLSPNRASNISGEIINPGEMAVFEFDIKSPLVPGNYKSYFTPVVDGLYWMKDLGIYWEIKVDSNTTIQYLETEEQEEFDINKVLENISKSVVKIFCKKEDQASLISKGSGTLFRNDDNDPNLPNYYITTNLHVVDPDTDYKSDCLIVLYPEYGNTERFIVFESKGYQYINKDIDFAILEPKSDRFVFKFLSLVAVSNTAKTKTNFLFVKRFINSSFVILSVCLPALLK